MRSGGENPRPGYNASVTTLIFMTLATLIAPPHPADPGDEDRRAQEKPASLAIHHPASADAQGLLQHWTLDDPTLIVTDPESSRDAFQARANRPGKNWRLVIIDSRLAGSVVTSPEFESWVLNGGSLALFRLYPEAGYPDWLDLPEWTEAEAPISDVQVADLDHPLTTPWRGSVWHRVKKPRQRMAWPRVSTAEWQVLACDDEGAVIAERGYGHGRIAVLQLPKALTDRHDVAVTLVQSLRRWSEGLRPSLELSPQDLDWIEAEDLNHTWPSRTDLRGFSGRGTVADNGAPSYEPISLTLPDDDFQDSRLWIRAYEGHQVPRSVHIQDQDGRILSTHFGRTRDRFTWWLAEEAPEGIRRVVDHPHSVEMIDAFLIAPKTFDPVWWGEITRALPERDRQIADHVLDTTPQLRRMREPLSVEDWDNRATDVKAALRRSLGWDFLDAESPPLDAESVRVLDRGDHVVECVHYQTLEGFRAPANLYLPKGHEPPYPAVLIAVGHWSVGKADEALQSQAVDLARAGIAALVPESLGQGERSGSNRAHQNTFSLLLSGVTARGVMLYELHRGLDYLESRDDIDATRLGSSGSSAGGLDSWLLPALDSRLNATAPVAFITGYRELVERSARQCSCVYFDQAGAQFDQSEIIALAAPRPFLVVFGDRDPLFPADGTRRMVREASVVYKLLGAEDSLQSFSLDVGHVHNQEMRERITGFMKQALLGEGDGAPIPERDHEQIAPEALFAFVEEDPSKKNLVTLARDAAERSKLQRAETDAADRLQHLREVLPESATEANPFVEVRSIDAFERVFSLGTWKTSYRQPIPALRSRSMPSSQEPKARVLWISSAPKEIPFLRPDVHRFLDENVEVITLDLPGTGELRYPDLLAARNGVLSDRPYLGRRLLALLEVSAALHREGHPFYLLGEDLESNLLIELALYLNREIAGGVSVGDFLASFEDLIGRQDIPESVFLPRVLARFDLPELRGDFPNRPLSRAQGTSEALAWILSQVERNG